MEKESSKKGAFNGWHRYFTLDVYSKRVRVIVLVFALLVIAGGVMIFPHVWKWVNRPISIVKVEDGFHNISQKRLKAVLSKVVLERFFSLDLSKVQKILLSMPWVSHVNIRKTWPGTLWIKIYERVPVARWNAHSLIDEKGHVFTPDNVASFKKLPLLQGGIGTAPEAWKYFSSVRKLLSSLPLNVTGFTLSEGKGWSFLLSDVFVVLGNKRHDERLQAFKVLYTQELKNKWNKVVRIDFRYPNGAAVAWKKK